MSNEAMLFMPLDEKKECPNQIGEIQQCCSATAERQAETETQNVLFGAIDLLLAPTTIDPVIIPVVAEILTPDRVSVKKNKFCAKKKVVRSGRINK
jgi:hypothetical protein